MGSKHKKEKLNKPDCNMAVVKMATMIWGFFSLGGGIAFIAVHYEEGLSNVFGYTLGKPLQCIYFMIAYAAAVFLIFQSCRFLYRSCVMDGKERKIFFYMLPVIIVLLVYLIKDVSAVGSISGYYRGDEKNIWDAAVRMYPFFFVYSSELFLICFLLFPFTLAPSIIKIIFVAYVFGYTIYRTKTYYKTGCAYLLYIIFALKPFLELGIRVHRMHWYAMLYLWVAIKLYYDHKERKLRPDLDVSKLIVVSVVLSILTIWRREGMYLAVWGFLLLGLTYVDWDHLLFWKNRENMHRLKGIFTVFFVAELFICVPELIFEMKMNHVAESTVTYQAYFVHMFAEESFDRNDCAQELAVINKFLDLEVIDRYNKECYGESYNDTYWGWRTWKEGEYFAITDYFIPQNQQEFNTTVMKIIKKQPVVFLKSRLTAFAMVAGKGNGYNLFLPLLLSGMVFLFAACKKDKVLIALSMGILGHAAITALTMPASYFKYFFEMYAFGWVFAAIIVIDIFCILFRKGKRR